MRYYIDRLVYNDEDETWYEDGKPEGRMSRGAALEIIGYVRRCEANARREFAEVVRLYSLVHAASSSPRSLPEEPT